MITVIDGKGVGAGKSYYVTDQISNHLARGGTTYAVETFRIKWEGLKQHCRDRHGVEIEEDQFHTFKESDLSRMHEVTPPGTEEMPVQVIADECQGELNARDTSDRSKRPFFNWLCQSRHDDTDVIFLSQHTDNVDVQIRRLATYCVETENMEYQYVPLIGALMKNYFRVTIWDRDKSCKQFPTKLVRKEPGIFASYVSKSQRGAHIRSGEAVGKKKLKRVRKKLSPMMKFLVALFVIVLCVVGYFGYRSVRGFMQITKKPGSAEMQRSGLGASSSAGSGQAAFDVEREIFRGTDGCTFLDTDKEQYLKGEMSQYGMVIGIQGHVALIETPDRRRLYVVADSGASSSNAGTLAGSVVSNNPAFGIMGNMRK